MDSIPQFVALFYTELGKVGIKKPQCDFDEARGILVMNVGKGAEGRTRVVPLKALALQYEMCKDANEKADLVKAAIGAFGEGLADVPREYATCGLALLPQLWPVEKIKSLELAGMDLPYCGLHGEDSREVRDLGVVLVYEHVAATGESGSAASFPIETPLLSSDLTRWSVGFTDALLKALGNLRSRTKLGPPPEKRWEYHSSGCGQTCWRDRFDAARAALLPALVARRRTTSPGGVQATDAGGHVVALATTSCVLATTSKNPLGLCFMGETLNVKLGQSGGVAGEAQRLSTTPYRLLKMRDHAAHDNSAREHPLNQKAGEGFVWRWVPYSPGGPPLKCPGEFCLPVDMSEVDGILNAIEHGKPVPVFSRAGSESTVGIAPAEQLFFAKKQEANQLFKAGEYVKAIAAYDAALSASPPTDVDAAVVQSNTAQALLNLAAKDSARKEACAAEALRRAAKAVELDQSNVKALARCAAACEILGESEAAAEFRARVANLSIGSSSASSSGSASIPRDCKAEV